MQQIKTLGTELPRQMARVRDEVLPMYVEIGSAGEFATTMMQMSLDAAAEAMAEGDVVKMLKAYESLKGFTT